MVDRTCSIDGCDRSHQARGWCKLHYERWRRLGTTEIRPVINKGKTCAADDCAQLAHAGGFCSTHYSRWMKHGSLEHPHPRSRAPEGYHWCSTCVVYKPVRDFYANRYRKLGLADNCKECQNKATKRWLDRHPLYRLENALARRGGISSRDSEGFTRAEIADRDGWRCQICGQRIGKRYSWPHPRSLSIDHIVPISADGKHERCNVQATHLGCNWKKNRGGTDQLRLIG